MSYRLINANILAMQFPEVNDMPCIYADLPHGLDNSYYDLRESGELKSYKTRCNKLQEENTKLRDAIYTNAGKYALEHMNEDELRIWATQQSKYIEELKELVQDLRLCSRESDCLKCEHGRFCDLRLDERCKELGIEAYE